jgi:hypothetical protein
MLGVAVVWLVGSLAAVQAAEKPRWVDPRCEPLPFTRTTPLVELNDGSLLTIDGNATRTTKDEGKTWSEPRKIHEGVRPGTPGWGCLLLKTRSGALVLLYLDMSAPKWGWDKAQGKAPPEARLDVWAIRSLDEGRTWIDRQKILDGYCGALITMIQTSSGRIAVPVQFLLRDPDRHAIYSYVSDDDGRTWRRGNILDLGGHGNHDGAMEPTLAELSDGRLLMLIRTNLDRFWEAYCDDKGLYWRVLRPSQLEASSAPAYLLRLASGRLALVWNRLGPEGKEPSGPYGGGPNSGHVSERRANWYREELSLALSADDGKTWSRPVVIVRQPRQGLSYPYLFERRPGELWVITRFNATVCVRLREVDFEERK